MLLRRNTKSQGYICARCLLQQARSRHPRANAHQLKVIPVWHHSIRRNSQTAVNASEPHSKLNKSEVEASQKEHTRDGGNNGALSTSSSKLESSNGEIDDARSAQKDSALRRRFEALTDDALSSTSAAASIQHAGFDEGLKNELLDRISAASTRSQYPQAHATAELPSFSGTGTRDVAAARPWANEESTSDAALRMLEDAKPRLRTPSRPIGGAARMPRKVDTGRESGSGKNKGTASGSNSGTRLLNARDKSSMYSFLKDDSLTPEEREKTRKQLRERFVGPKGAPGVGIPATLQGLASLANERIEDAIARGQFKNLPSRGKVIERDHNMSSPFLDTTEYFMNKIIQRQDIAPPWIEKQQELVQQATRFRTGLRLSWKRHAARVIASKGGSLESQTRRAKAYAAAEDRFNPVSIRRRELEEKRKFEEQQRMEREQQGVSSRTSANQSIDVAAQHLSQISPAGELKIASAVADADGSNPLNQEEREFWEEVVEEAGKELAALATEVEALEDAAVAATANAPISAESNLGIAEDVSRLKVQEEAAIMQEVVLHAHQGSITNLANPEPIASANTPPLISTRSGATGVFRDPEWQKAELAYHTVAIQQLNDLTRSYNLMAPQLARKPYFNLERELNNAFAEVAPLIAAEIVERATAPKNVLSLGDAVSGRAVGMLDGVTGHRRAQVYDERRPQYGMKEFWRDFKRNVFGRGVSRP